MMPVPRTRLTGIVAAASAAVVGALPPVAAGDAVYHSQHMRLAPVGDARLRSGFVENIKANGPIVYAHEVYVLNGASPRTAYTVWNHFYVGDSRCEDPDAESPFQTAVLMTNRSGNGRADIVFSPEDIGGLTGTHSARWTIRNAADQVIYRTGCTTVELD
jgi:hypothetical protein